MSQGDAISQSVTQFYNPLLRDAKLIQTLKYFSQFVSFF